VVALRDGVGEPLEHYDAHAIAEDRAASLRVERAATPIGRKDAALVVLITALVRKGDRNSAR
jgi:hypothetical protein